jgi:hypothetical protein
MFEGDDVTRCYCNEASCVMTGYMCKSTVGVCFSQLTPGGVGIRHACAESLPAADLPLCLAAAARDVDVVIRTRLPETEVEGGWSELACCRTDMCNYYYFRSGSDELKTDSRNIDGTGSTLNGIAASAILN